MFPQSVVLLEVKTFFKEQSAPVPHGVMSTPMIAAFPIH